MIHPPLPNLTGPKAMQRFRCAIALAALVIAPVAWSQDVSSPPVNPVEGMPTGDQPLLASPPASVVAPQAIAPECQPCSGADAETERAEVAELEDEKGSFKNIFGNFARDPGAYSIVSVARGLSTHKSMFVLPYTWSDEYDGSESEAMFQISAKQALFGSRFYLGYTQKSFWQVYNTDESRPFRETNYNPELFYRWTPDPKVFRHWGADIGIEHESNGEDVPKSRSWNRAYIAPFYAAGQTLIYTKIWYRIPDDPKEYPLDPKGDDNPDIEHFYGYGEVTISRQLKRGHLINIMGRGSIADGKGGININYTIPSKDGYLFWMIYAWHGYGESLLNYNHSITRIGFGAALSR